VKKNGIISLGEAFVDFIATDESNTNYETFLGGTTVNVAAGTSRLGVSSYYICKLGTDAISEFVQRELKKEQVNIDYCIVTPEKEICSVYVHISENKERYFHTYVNNTPDAVITHDELTAAPFRQAKIFHFGSVTLLDETVRQTTRKALELAKKSGLFVSFDPNIRPKRWISEEECREMICSFFPRANIVKLTDDELLFVTKAVTIEEGLERLSQYNIPYVFITLGKEGSYAVHHGKKVKAAAADVEVVDTTGAGDAFMSAILYCFHEKGMPKDTAVLETYITFANMIGALATTKTGALTALPAYENIPDAYKL
jgi:fructokinase